MVVILSVGKWRFYILFQISEFLVVPFKFFLKVMYKFNTTSKYDQNVLSFMTNG